MPRSFEEALANMLNPLGVAVRLPSSSGDIASSVPLDRAFLGSIRDAARERVGVRVPTGVTCDQDEVAQFASWFRGVPLTLGQSYPYHVPTHEEHWRCTPPRGFIAHGSQPTPICANDSQPTVELPWPETFDFSNFPSCVLAVTLHGPLSQHRSYIRPVAQEGPANGT